MRQIGNKFLNNVEVSAQEAIYLLLQMPLKKSSRHVLFLNTNPPEERIYLLKSNLDKLKDDEEVAESNLITRYVNRSPQIESVCLADYAALYDGIAAPRTDNNSDEEPESDEESHGSISHASTSKLTKRRKVPRVLRTIGRS